MAKDPHARWSKATLRLYGYNVKVCYQSIDGLWYSSSGQRLLRVVVVRDPGGHRRDDCFFSTGFTLRPTEIIGLFCFRWPLEACFRDFKQLLGFEDPQNRVSKATPRTALLALYIYNLALLWYAQSGHQLKADLPLPPRWYPQTTSVSFEDVLRTLRYITWQERVFGDPALDPHARKTHHPLTEWVKGVA